MKPHGTAVGPTQAPSTVKFFRSWNRRSQDLLFHLGKELFVWKLFHQQEHGLREREILKSAQY